MENMDEQLVDKITREFQRLCLDDHSVKFITDENKEEVVFDIVMDIFNWIIPDLKEKTMNRNEIYEYISEYTSLDIRDGIISDFYCDIRKSECKCLQCCYDIMDKLVCNELEMY